MDSSHLSRGIWPDRLRDRTATSKDGGNSSKHGSRFRLYEFTVWGSDLVVPQCSYGSRRGLIIGMATYSWRLRNPDARPRQSCMWLVLVNVSTSRRPFTGRDEGRQEAGVSHHTGAEVSTAWEQAPTALNSQDSFSCEIEASCFWSMHVAANLESVWQRLVMLEQQEQLPDSQRSTLHDWDSGGYMREALRSRFPALEQLAAPLSHEVTHCSKKRQDNGFSGI